MAGTLRLPNGAMLPFSDNYTPEQAWEAAKKLYPDAFVDPNNPGPQGGFGAAFRAGAERMKGETALSLARTAGNRQEEAEEYFKAKQESARNIFKPTEEGWTEAPLQKFKETLGGSLPYALATFGGAGAGYVTRSPQLGLAAMASPYVGSNLAAQMEDGKALEDTSLLAAAGTAVPQAYLDRLGLRATPGLRKLVGEGGVDAAKTAVAQKGVGAIVKDYGQGILRAAPIEGATEVGQNVLQRMQAQQDLLSPEALQAYKDDFIAGAVLGGTFSVPGRYVERSAAQQQLTQENIKAQEVREQAMFAAEQQAAQAEATRLNDPEYRTNLKAKWDEATATKNTMVQQTKALAEELKAARAENAPTVDLLQNELKALNAQVKEYQTNVIAPLQAEYAPVYLAEQRMQRQQAAAPQQTDLFSADGATPQEQLETSVKQQLKTASPEEAGRLVQQLTAFDTPTTNNTVDAPATDIVSTARELRQALQQAQVSGDIEKIPELIEQLKQTEKTALEQQKARDVEQGQQSLLDTPTEQTTPTPAKPDMGVRNQEAFRQLYEKYGTSPTEGDVNTPQESIPGVEQVSARVSPEVQVPQLLEKARTDKTLPAPLRERVSETIRLWDDISKDPDAASTVQEWLNRDVANRQVTALSRDVAKIVDAANRPQAPVGQTTIDDALQPRDGDLFPGLEGGSAVPNKGRQKLAQLDAVIAQATPAQKARLQTQRAALEQQVKAREAAVEKALKVRAARKKAAPAATTAPPAPKQLGIADAVKQNKAAEKAAKEAEMREAEAARAKEAQDLKDRDAREKLPGELEKSLENAKKVEAEALRKVRAESDLTKLEELARAHTAAKAEVTRVEKALKNRETQQENTRKHLAAAKEGFLKAEAAGDTADMANKAADIKKLSEKLGIKPERPRAAKKPESSEGETTWSDTDNLLLRAKANITQELTPAQVQQLTSGNVASAVASIANTSKNPVIRRTARRIAGLLDGVRVVVVDKMPGDVPDALGGITRDGKTVYLNRSSGLDVATFMHEAVHAATLRVLEMPASKRTPAQNAAVRDLEKIYSEAATDKNLPSEVARESLLEFVAEAHVNPKVHAYLEARKSLFRRFVEAIARLLGVEVPPKGPMLDKFLDASETIFAPPPFSGTTGVAYRKQETAAPNALKDLADTVVAGEPTLKEKYIGDNPALGLHMAFIDARSAATKASEIAAEVLKDSRVNTQVVYSINMADQKFMLMQQALESGFLKHTQDQKGLRGIEASGNVSGKDVYKAVGEIPDRYGDAEAKDALATAYLAGRRAQNKGIDRLNSNELELDKDKVAAAMSAVEADPELKKALDKVATTYNQFNTGMLNWLGDTGAISKKTVDNLLKDKDYVPFYRVMGDGSVILQYGNNVTIRVGDIKNQPYMQELKGGDQKILPLTKSLQMNTMLLIDKGTVNMATRNLATALSRAGASAGKMQVMSGKGPAEADVLRFSVEPENEKDTGDRWIRVDTAETPLAGVPGEIIVRSLEGSIATMPSAWMKIAAQGAQLLRAGITRMPLYALRQLVRDPAAAAFTSGVEGGAYKAILTGFKNFAKQYQGNNDTGKALARRGLVQSHVFEGNESDIQRIALMMIDGKDASLWRKAMNVMDKAGINADVATRVLVYESAKKQGLSDIEAAVMTMEHMNFYKRGLNPDIQRLTRMIPFMNAQFQALNVLAKAMRGKMPYSERLQIKQKFFNNALLLVASGTAYAALMDDNDAYKNAKPRDRYANWFIPMPDGSAVKIPLPYELGWFAALGMSGWDAMTSDIDSKQQLNALRGMVLNSVPGLSSAYVPQIVKPVAEVLTNTNFFTGDAVLPARLANLSPEAQYNASTTEMAKTLGSMLGISPIKLEHVVKGYLGQAPIAVAAATNSIFADETSAERAEKRPHELPFVGQAVQRKYGGVDSEAMYEYANKHIKVLNTINAKINELNPQAAQKYLQENRADLQKAAWAKEYLAAMRTINSQRRQVQSANVPALTAERKREMLERLDAVEAKVAKKFAEVYDRLDD